MVIKFNVYIFHISFNEVFLCLIFVSFLACGSFSIVYLVDVAKLVCFISWASVQFIFIYSSTL